MSKVDSKVEVVLSRQDYALLKRIAAALEAMGPQREQGADPKRLMEHPDSGSVYVYTG